MSYTYTCSYCNCTFEALRSDAKYCTAVCRTRSANSRKEKEERSSKKKLQKQQLLNQYNKLKSSYHKNRKNYACSEEVTAGHRRLVKEANFLLSLPADKLFEYYKKAKLKNIEPSSYTWYSMSEQLEDNFEYQGVELLSTYKKHIQTKQSESSRYLKEHSKLKEKINQLVKELEKLKKEIDELEKPTLSNIDFGDLSFLDPKPKKEVPHKSYRERKQPKRRKRRPIPKIGSEEKEELGGEDVLNMQFNTYTLPGELGRFLGELDKNKVAFALTGDSGAGKSYFSFQLARLLLDGGMSVKYYSLEEGIGKLTQEKLYHYDIGNDLKITAEGSLSTIRKDAEKFDAIIIDSYPKISTKPAEFEQLRQNYPQTLFIIIFQKTTGKTIRGGSSIKYNSSATIDVQLQDEERVAVMEKGRYGTQNWVYSITNNRVIKET